MYRRYKRPDPFARTMRWLVVGSFRLTWRAITWGFRGAQPCEAPSEDAIRLFYMSPAWQMLARKVKDQRGRKCECCGAKYPNVRIVTDHIKSLRNHWHLRLNPSNMQILCDVCNRHKGSRVDADFRKLSKGGLLSRLAVVVRVI
jgi:hypothetical protein